MEFDTQSAAPVRMAIFIGLMVLFALIEAKFPRKRRAATRKIRWFANLSMVVLGSVLIRVTLSGAAVGVAIFAEAQGLGVLNALDVPFTAAFLITLVMMDFAIWAQHLVMHRVPFLWRLHSMHHLDPDVDVTTALRFHPIEYWLSMLLKMALVVVLGPPAVAVVVFEVGLNALAMFNHANMALPVKIDRGLRLLIVTPDMHRVHHSVIGREHNSNFGFNLSIWDRLFSTYRDQPEQGHDGMEIGLGVQGQKATGLVPLLTWPFAPTSSDATEPQDEDGA